MLEKIITSIREHRSFFLYICIGFTGLTLDFVTFLLLVRVLHLPELVANPISMSVGIINNFFLNAFFNFRETDRLLSRFLSFYAVGIVGILVGNFILWFFNGVIGNSVSSLLAYIWQPLSNYRLELVKGGSIIVIGVMQYFLNKYISFRK
jgi:putative flippase GtrA